MRIFRRYISIFKRRDEAEQMKAYYARKWLNDLHLANALIQVSRTAMSETETNHDFTPSAISCESLED